VTILDPKVTERLTPIIKTMGVNKFPAKIYQSFFDVISMSLTDMIILNWLICIRTWKTIQINRVLFKKLSIIMARERLKFWLNYKMSLFSFHYCDFVKLQNTLLTTIGIQLAISKLILPSLREPRHTLKFPDNKLFHK